MRKFRLRCMHCKEPKDSTRKIGFIYGYWLTKLLHQDCFFEYRNRQGLWGKWQLLFFQTHPYEAQPKSSSLLKAAGFALFLSLQPFIWLYQSLNSSIRHSGEPFIWIVLAVGAPPLLLLLFYAALRYRERDKVSHSKYIEKALLAEEAS